MTGRQAGPLLGHGATLDYPLAKLPPNGKQKEFGWLQQRTPGLPREGQLPKEVKGSC